MKIVAVPASTGGGAQQGRQLLPAHRERQTQTIGRLSAHLGNAGVLLRAYIYARLLGREGMQRVAEFSTLNANYMLAELKKRGFDLASPSVAPRTSSLSHSRSSRTKPASAPWTSPSACSTRVTTPRPPIPLLVPECFLIEPTETETREELDGFIQAMEAIAHEARTAPDVVKGAPHTLPVKRSTTSRRRANSISPGSLRHRMGSNAQPE